MNIIIAIIISAVTFIIFKFLFKEKTYISLLFALVVFCGLELNHIKPFLEIAGYTVGTNVILGIAAIVMLVLLFLNVPVYISILAASLIYFVFNPGINEIVFGQKFIIGTESLSLLAIPFFVCAGIFMNYSGVTTRILNFCSVLTGRLPGGLAQVNVLLSAFMGGLSGSNLADAAMEAKMLVPEMERNGFSKEFSSVVTAVSAMITPLIPPGIAMILYGCIADVSIGKLFVSGLAVGTILCIAMMILVHIISKKRGYVPLRTQRITAAEFWGALKPALLPLTLPVVIIGGIRLGVFTATEAGAVSILYAIFLGLIYKELSIQSIISACKETINKYIFLICVNILVLIAGMFIEGNATMIVLVPLLAPVAAQYGINEIHFAMMYIFNSAIGALSPPMGTLMFVTCGITKCKTKDFIIESIPFYIMLFIVLVLLTFFPVLTTGIVDLVY